MQDKKKKIHEKKMRFAGLLLVVLLLLCGCTKKEELLLLSGESDSTVGETDLTEELQSEEDGPLMGNTPAAPVKSVQDASTEGIPDTDKTSAEEQDVIYVHVCGAVLCPGVYELKAKSRVYEAVQEAGGFAEGADQNYVNQAQELGDGVKLVIPTVEEAAASREGAPATGTMQESTADTGMGGQKSVPAQIGIVQDTVSEGSGNGGQAEGSGSRININTASEAQLCDIPGIGATRAAAIAAYREAHGGFQKPEDIMKVNGIKEGMYEKIKDSISVN